MSMRQTFMVMLLGLALVCVLGATAAKDVTNAGMHESIWLDRNASEGLLASRLNITSIAKTPRVSSARVSLRTFHAEGQTP